MYFAISTLAYAAVAGLLTTTVYAHPHDQMVNNDFVRDVGIVYPNVNFTGDPLYLITHKQAPKCETNISGRTLGSAQICVPTTCIFYKVLDPSLFSHHR